MKILQVIPSFYPSTGYGGGPLVAYEISKNLIKLGHKVTVLTTDSNDNISRLKAGKFLVDEIEIHYLKNLDNNLAYKHKIFLSRGIFSFFRKNTKFDVMHLHDYRTYQNLIAYHHAQKYHIPYVLQPHGALPDSESKMVLKKIFDIAFGYQLLKNASKILPLNDSEANRLNGIVPKEKIEIIPNGINLSQYRTIPSYGEFKRENGLKYNEKFILYIGRLHESKGIDLLLKCYANLHTQNTLTKLIIAGPNDGYLDNLKTIARELKIFDDIIFPGYLSQTDKLKAFVDADVFVTPKFYGFPLTFLEAMVCGVPIVTTDRGDAINWINGNIGYTTHFSIDELTERINQILTNQQLNQAFRQNSREMVKKFDWPFITQQIERIYSSLLVN